MLFLGKKISILMILTLALQLFVANGAIYATENIAAPTNVIAKNYNPSDVYIKWDTVSGANGYRLYKIVDEQKELIKETTDYSTTLTKLAEGTYTLAVSALKGSSESVLSNPVTIEINYPEMYAPESFNYKVINGNDIKLTWGTAVNAQSYNVYQIVNGDKKLIKSATGTSITLNNVIEGTYSYAISSVHSFYGESTLSTSVNIDLVHPNMQAPTLVTYTIKNGNDIELTWNKSDYAISYNVYQVTNSESKLIKTTNSLSETIRNLPEGSYSYAISAYSDRFGESSLSQLININLIHPDMQAPFGLKSVLLNGNDVFLKWDNVMYATSYKVYQIINGQKELLNITNGNSIQFSRLPEGEFWYEVSSYSNRFGESEITNSISVDIVYPIIQAPVASVKMIDENVAKITWESVPYATSYNVYEVVDGQVKLLRTRYSTDFTLPDLPEGTYEYVVTANSDRFGESVYSNKAVVDAGPPLQAPAETNASVEGNTATLTWDEVTRAASYNVYEVINGELKLVENTTETSLTIEDLPEGSSEFRIVPVNAAGEESENYSTITVETAPSDVTPPVTVSDLVEACTNQDVAVQLTATDDESGVAKTFYSIDGAEFVEGTTFTISEEGEHEVSFYSVDNAGNKEDATTVKVHVDKTAPVTTSNAVEGWLNQDTEIGLTVTDNGCGVDKTFYSVDDSEFVEGSTVLVDEGIHQVSFYSIDKAGNKEETKTIEVKVDKTPPVTTSDAPADWSKEDVTVQLTATDNLIGVDKTYYSINDSEFLEGTSFTVSEEGVTNVSFYSVDKAGNIEEAQTIEVKIDKTAPETNSNVMDSWSKEDFTVELTVTDNLSGVDKTYYSVNGSEYVEGTSFTISEDGIHEVSFYSVDKAGNVEEAKTVEVKVDKTAPEVSWDLADEYALGTDLPSYTANDAVSGIASKVLTVNGQEVSNITLDQPGNYNVVLTVTDHAGWTTTVEKSYVVYIPATVKIKPGVIQENTGKFTVRVTLPAGFDSNGFDLETAKLDGVKANTGTNGLINQSKEGQFKFDREDFTWTSGNRTMEFRAMVNGYLVIGHDTVQVKTK